MIGHLKIHIIQFLKSYLINSIFVILNEHFPNSEWLVGTIQKTSGYYEKTDLKLNMEYS